MPNVNILESPAAVAAAAAEWLAARIKEAVVQRASAHVALAGGTTPRSAYETLGRDASVPWSRVRFYFTDERCVGPEDEDSNFRMAHEALTRAGHATDAAFFRMQGELADREAAARAYAAQLPETLDVAVLGIGEDGHTASLFPASEALDEARRRVVPVRGAKPPPWRLTLTPPVLAQARALLVLVTGAGKAAAVERALAAHGDALATPARLAASETATWLLDRAAAGSTRAT